MSQDPYRPPDAQLIEPERAPRELAPRGTRLAATILDQLFVLPAVLPLISSLGRDEEPSVVAFGLAGALVLALLVANLVLMGRRGQSLAKAALGIRVVRSDGSPISLGRYVGLRILPIGVLSQIPLLGGLVGIADAVAIYRDGQRCLHDDLADTIVVRA